MKITDIHDGLPNDQGGQEFKTQTVKTPFGELVVKGFVRVPRLSASKRTWNVWFLRFAHQAKPLHPKNMEKQLETIKKWEASK